MTSVAVAPGSLGAPPSVFTPKMYHLQQGLNSTSPSPTPGKLNSTGHSCLAISSCNSTAEQYRRTNDKFDFVVRTANFMIAEFDILRISVYTGMTITVKLQNAHLLRSSGSRALAIEGKYPCFKLCNHSYHIRKKCQKDTSCKVLEKRSVVEMEPVIVDPPLNLSLVEQISPIEKNYWKCDLSKKQDSKYEYQNDMETKPEKPGEDHSVRERINKKFKAFALTVVTEIKICSKISYLILTF
ncbi:hypothetical protein WN51_05631 [Melipona quadrifasciata]|uniref:Uncharacterized protein n=1 Tax=Melipona quadrifasciata TaxID=166423 RepID=A0A0M8ZSF6_9HYME|nr:hypothetical protein WN51_05631 [Melipona quadrifasciata]